MKKKLLECTDFEVVPKEVWDFWVKKYGVVDNNTAIERKVKTLCVFVLLFRCIKM